MKTTVIGVMRTHLDDKFISVKNENMPEILEDLKRFSGAEAGICYMSKPYFDSYVSDPVKAAKRFVTVSSTGHHSIAGHAQVSVLFEDMPKILAMYLNNLNDYETSEKSGRYTVMDGQTDKEIELYNKWREIFEKKINEVYNQPGGKTLIDEKTVNKLAMENARYLLSVFMPMTMGYTASLRQWNYIIDWAERYISSDLPNNYFFTNVKKWMGVLVSQLKEILYVDELRDFKGLNGFNMINPDEKRMVVEQYGRVYNVKYDVTFAVYAHLHRHRTLLFNMYFDGISRKFYVPKIIRGTDLENEWLKDISSLADIVPTGTLISAEESGRLDKFFLRAMERNCGRALLETMDNAFEVYDKFMTHYNMFGSAEQTLLDKHTIRSQDGSYKPKMKGQLLKCKEPCIWGCEGSRNRLI